jgi:tetratricopeptide (TPR) repeat protein
MAFGLAAGLTMATAPELTSQRNDRRMKLAVCLFLSAIIWLVFAQTLGHDFINFDDDKYVYENSEVSRGLTVEGFKWLLTHSHASLWHPLTTLSHMLDCQLYGLKPDGHHFTNVVLHNIGAVLLFLVLSGMTVRPSSPRDESVRLADRTGTIWPSAFVAAIFAIHPMRVESVAWVTERKDVLSGVFLMLTLAAYVRYTRARSLSRYLTMSICLACGLMSKATFVPVPLVLLLLDYWPLGRVHRSQVSDQPLAARGRSLDSTSRHLNSSTPRLVLEKIPLLLLSVAAAAVTVFVQRVTMPTLDQLPLLPRIKNAIVSLVLYLGQMFWPTDLAIFYPHPHDQLNIWIVVACAALLIAITLLVILWRQQRPYLFVGWFWFLILVAPVSGIFQAGLQARADRFTYLPHIGITIALAWFVADQTRQWRNQSAVLASAGSCIVIVFAAISWEQTTYWSDSISIWERALAVTTNNQTAHRNLAAALYARGRMAESKIHSRTADIIHAQTTLKDYPLDVHARDDLGLLLVQSGDLAGAIEQWETSLRIDPNDGNALNNLAWVLATCPSDGIRNGARAVELAKKATSLPGGESPLVLRTLAAAYAETGNFDDAISATQRALELATAQGNLSLVETLRHELDVYQAHTPYREKAPE